MGHTKSWLKVNQDFLKTSKWQTGFLGLRKAHVTRIIFLQAKYLIDGELNLGESERGFFGISFNYFFSVQKKNS